MREEEEKKRTNDVFFLLAMRRYTLLPTRLLVLHDGAGDGCYAIWVGGRWGIRMGVVLGLGAALLKCFGQVRAEGVYSWAFSLLLCMRSRR